MTILPGQPLASHPLLGSLRGTLDPFTDRFYRTLLGLAHIHVSVVESATAHTYALYPMQPVVVYTPHSDRTAYQTEHHELSSQRESEGMAWTDDETDHLPSHED